MVVARWSKVWEKGFPDYLGFALRIYLLSIEFSYEAIKTFDQVKNVIQ